MTSFLPPRLRDTRSLTDRVRQDRINLKQLGVGLVNGRWSPARPLGQSALFGDFEDDALDDELEFINTDRAVAVVDTVMTLALTYEPVEGSLHVRWNGIDVPPTEFTLTEQTVTFANDHLHVGDVLTAAYAHYPGEEPEAPELAAWYRLDDTGAQMTDYSGNEHHGSYTAVNLGKPSLMTVDPDAAAEWNGTTSHALVSFGDWMNSAEISVAILLKGASYGTLVARDHTVFGRLWDLRVGSSFGGSGGNLGFVFGGVFFAAQISTTGLNLGDNVRHMAGFSYDGATLKLYVDGVLRLTQSVAAAYTGPDVPLTIGGAQDGSGGSFVDLYTGVLDECRVYSEVISDGNFADLWAES